MPNQKISQMTPATALDGTESVPLVQGGVNKKGSMELLASHAKTLGYREVVDAGNYTMIGDKNVIGMNKTVSATTTIIVSMASLTAGVPYTVKDVKGDCDSYNITITPDSGTIDGAASYALNNPYQSVTFFKDGTKLIIIG
jgi:hypothetical protein